MPKGCRRQGRVRRAVYPDGMTRAGGDCRDSSSAATGARPGTGGRGNFSPGSASNGSVLSHVVTLGGQPMRTSRLAASSVSLPALLLALLLVPTAARADG